MKKFILATLAALLLATPAFAEVINLTPNGSGGGAATSVTVGTTTITGGTDTRLLYDNAGVLGETASVTYNNGTGALTTANVTLGASNVLSWTGRGILTSPGTSSVQLGAIDVDTNAAIVAQTTRSQGNLAGGTSDQAGKNWTFIASPGKGTGAGGSFIFQTTPAGSTGTVVGTPTTALTIASTQQVTMSAGIAASSTSTGTLVVTGGVGISGALIAGGSLQGTTVQAGQTSNIVWATRSLMTSPADGQITMAVNATGDFGRLNFGGATSSFPALKRSTTTLVFRLADDSADTAFTASTATFTNVASDAASTDATLCRRTSDGLLLVGSGTLGICLGTSSERFKTSIETLKPGLAEIMALQPKEFYLDAEHGDPNKLNYGFIAEDCIKTVPYLTGLDAEGRPNTCDYLGMVPILVKALQDQQAQIADLRARIR